MKGIATKVPHLQSLPTTRKLHIRTNTIEKVQERGRSGNSTITEGAHHLILPTKMFPNLHIQPQLLATLSTLNTTQHLVLSTPMHLLMISNIQQAYLQAHNLISTSPPLQEHTDLILHLLLKSIYHIPLILKTIHSPGFTLWMLNMATITPG